MHYDRFDICEAYLVMEWDSHVGGWLRERESNRRRGEATSIQLHRIRFKPRPGLSWETLSENGQEIYAQLCERYGFDLPEWAIDRGEAYAREIEAAESMAGY